jgi:predicted RNA-binding Zn-ribbon protein involved in translation (DUF1610 family)
MTTKDAASVRVKGMSDTEAIQAVRDGNRCITSTTLTGFKEQTANCNHRMGFRTVACDFETDVIECPLCGEQKLSRCNFDEDMA